MGDGVFHGDAVVAPAALAVAGLLGELIEQGVGAVVGGPDAEVEAPGAAALGGFPEFFGVLMLGKFIEADVAPEDGHGVRVAAEGEDAGAVLEFDVIEFDFLGEFLAQEFDAFGAFGEGGEMSAQGVQILRGEPVGGDIGDGTAGGAGQFLGLGFRFGQCGF